MGFNKGYNYTHTPTKGHLMLKVLSKNKLNSILAECLTTPSTVKVLSFTVNGVANKATTETVYNVFAYLDFYRELGGKEQPQYAVLPDGNVMLGLTSTRPDGREQVRRYFIVRFEDTNFLN